MKDGFIKTGCASVRVTVGDPQANLAEIKKSVQEADQAGIDLLVFPELCITGYSCGDLFYQNVLIDQARDALLDLCRFSKDYDSVIAVGLPYCHQNKLYNCAAVINKGTLLGLVPKTYLKRGERR